MASVVVTFAILTDSGESVWNGSGPNDPAVDAARPLTLAQQKNPCEGRCCRHIAGVSEAEAPVGVEPTMADLQSRLSA